MVTAFILNFEYQLEALGRALFKTEGSAKCLARFIRITKRESHGNID
jgi:hypothetical protein